jgi:hypothetical protein
MNKRIKSLIERAEYQAKKQSGYEDWEVYVPPDPQVVFEKFAELIVRECAQVGFDYADGHCCEISAVILEHFGVEE